MRRLPALVLAPLCALACTAGEGGGSKGPVDADGDGYVADEDCDDADAARYPGAPEPCDNVDNDCDGIEDIDDPDVDLGTVVQYPIDSDGDGFGDPTLQTAACAGGGPPAGAADNRDDCDDRDDAVAPGADERCDGVDNDCDGLVDAEDDSVLGLPSWGPDLDEDGFGDAAVGERACERPFEGWVEDASDCDDRDAEVFPGAEEVCGDARDSDCDGADGPALFPGDTDLTCGRGLFEGAGGPIAVGSADADAVAEVAWVHAEGVALLGSPGEAGPWALPVPLGPGAQVALAQGDVPGLWLGDPGAADGSGAVAFLSGAWSGDRSATDLVEIDAGGEALGVAVAATVDGGLLVSDAGGLLWYARPTSPGAGVRLRGDAAEAGIQVVEAIGDLDGDGVADAVVGIPEGDGAVIVLTGPVRDAALSGARVSGAPGDALGAALTARGDLDGDGRADLAVGAPGTDRVYLIAGGELRDGAAPDLAWAQPEGVEGDRAGAAVAYLGAVAGDARQGLAVGAPGAEDGAGIAFIGLGPFGGVQPLRAIAFEVAGAPGAGAGRAVAGLGDANGDGNADLAVAGVDLVAVFWGQRGL